MNWFPNTPLKVRCTCDRRWQTKKVQAQGKLTGANWVVGQLLVQARAEWNDWYHQFGCRFAPLGRRRVCHIILSCSSHSFPRGCLTLWETGTWSHKNLHTQPPSQPSKIPPPLFWFIDTWDLSSEYRWRTKTACSDEPQLQMKTPGSHMYPWERLLWFLIYLMIHIKLRIPGIKLPVMNRHGNSATSCGLGSAGGTFYFILTFL